MFSSVPDNPNLRACPTCGAAVSIRARSCPHCGDPLESEGAVVTLAAPSVPVHAPGEDTIYYQDEQVTVSATRLVVGEKTYAMTNLTSVAMVQQPNSARGCLVCAGFVGISLALAGLASMSEAGGVLFFLLGMVLRIGGLDGTGSGD